MTSAPDPDRRPATIPANQASSRPQHDDHRAPGDRGAPGHHDPRDAGGNDGDGDGDRRDVRGRTRHVNRHRSGHNGPGDSRRPGNADPDSVDASTQDRDRYASDHHDSDVRDQVQRLRDQGDTYRSIAAAAGLPPATLYDLASGRRPPTPATTRALAQVTSASLRRARVDAGGTRLRLRALHVMGHSSARIARALGVREMTIRAIVRGDAPTVSTALRDQAADLYDTWWDKRAPERGRAERGAATAARRRAIRGNWCAGAGLDDDHLDTPGYKPAAKWKRATGTGVAPDVQPPGHPGKTRQSPRRPNRRQP
jgi:transcriptional regulator with XRE-family HTH domain